MKYYDPAHLYVAETPIFLRVNCADVVGFAKFTPAGKPRFHVGTLRDYYALPPRCKVEAWRPVDPDQFPDQLPASPKKLMAVPAWHSPPEPRSEPEEAEVDHGWPYPRVRLGRPSEPPQSVQECEARILRFLRTREHLEREFVKVEKAWPPELLVAASVVDKMLAAAPTRRLACLREDDYMDFHHDASDKRPLPSRWEPTPRDVSEWESGEIIKWIPKKNARLFYWRSSRPPYSWRQISDFMRVPDHLLQQWYATLCQEAFRRASR